MKKRIMIILCSILMFALTGCGAKETQYDRNTKSSIEIGLRLTHGHEFVVDSIEKIDGLDEKTFFTAHRADRPDYIFEGMMVGSFLAEDYYIDNVLIEKKLEAKYKKKFVVTGGNQYKNDVLDDEMNTAFEAYPVDEPDRTFAGFLWGDENILYDLYVDNIMATKFIPILTESLKNIIPEFTIIGETHKSIYNHESKIIDSEMSFKEWMELKDDERLEFIDSEWLSDNLGFVYKIFVPLKYKGTIDVEAYREAIIHILIEDYPKLPEILIESVTFYESEEEWIISRYQEATRYGDSRSLKLRDLVEEIEDLPKITDDRFKLIYQLQYGDDAYQRILVCDYEDFAKASEEDVIEMWWTNGILQEGLRE